MNRCNFDGSNVETISKFKPIQTIDFLTIKMVEFIGVISTLQKF